MREHHPRAFTDRTGDMNDRSIHRDHEIEMRDHRSGDTKIGHRITKIDDIRMTGLLRFLQAEKLEAVLMLLDERRDLLPGHRAIAIVRMPRTSFPNETDALFLSIFRWCP